MSIEVTSTVEVTTDTVDTVVSSAGDLVSNNTHEPWLQEQEPLVDVIKSEYSIVGDALFATTTSETPYWLSVLIDNVVANSITSGLGDYATLNQNIIDAVGRIDVVENTYVEQINLTALVDGIVNSRFTTLNARVDGHDATIVDLATVQSTIDNSIAINNASLTTSWNDDITSSANTITAAYSAADATLTSSINALTSSFTDQASDITANATAVQGLQTFVGVDGNNVPDGTGLNQTVTSHSTAFTNLENGVTGPTGDVAYSLSNLEQRSAAYADTEGARVENKFSYNSTINLNGQFHEAGFGIGATGSGTGTELDPFQSEFWINAEKFKFTNTNQTGQAAPFTIDASGVTPQVTFDGIVSFSNTDMSAYDNSLVDVSYDSLSGKDTLAQQFGYVDYSALQTAASGGNTVINGGYLNTNLVQANAITADKLFAGELITNTAQIKDAIITTAKIGDAAITSAKIGTAEVDTLNIAGQAVTIPVGYYAASKTTLNPTSWTTVASTSFTSTGAPIQISFTGVMVSPQLNDFHRYRIRVNGVVEYTTGPIGYGAVNLGFAVGLAENSVALTYNYATGTIGSISVDVQGLTNNTGSGIENRAMTCLEVKR